MEENKGWSGSQPNDVDSSNGSWNGQEQSNGSWNGQEQSSGSWDGQEQPNAVWGGSEQSNTAWNGQEQGTSWGGNSTNMGSWDGNSNGGWDQSQMGWDQPQSMNSNQYNDFDSSQMTFAQYGYNNQANCGYDNNQGDYNNYGYDNNQNGYDQQGDYGYNQGYGDFGYGDNQNGYGQNMYGYPQNNGYGSAMNAANPENEEKKEKTKKPKKKLIIIGSISAAVIAAVVVVCILFLGGGKKLPKDIADFEYTEDVTYEEFLEAYYNGNEKSFLRSASTPDFNDLLNNPSKYTNDTVAISGYVTSVEGSLYYLSENLDSYYEYCCFNGGDSKTKISQGDYLEIFGIFTQVSDNNAYPCIVVWKYESKDAPVAVTPSDPSPTGEVVVPDVELDDDAQNFVDNLDVTYIGSANNKGMYYYIENNNEDNNYTSARLNIYFYDASDECVAFNSHDVYFATNQPYAFGYIASYDSSNTEVEYERAAYYFDDVYIFSTEREQYFDFADVEIYDVSSSDYMVTGKLTNSSAVTLNLSGYLVFYNEDKEILSHTWISENDVEVGSQDFSDFCYVSNEDIDTYDIFWDSVSPSN